MFRLSRGTNIMTKLIPLKALTSGSNALSLFTKAKPRDFVRIRQSIEKDGLLYPLVVVKEGAKYLVIDGKKRLSVIRKLAKSKRYSRSTAKIPCLVQDVKKITPVMARRPALLTGPELAHQIMIAAQSRVSHASIAQRFECDLSVVEDCVSLPKLHPELLMHFNNKTISLEQAAAFATIENMGAQLSLLHQLGPFVSNTEIIQAIRTGATVIEISEENIIVLPSRGRPIQKVNPSKNIDIFGSKRQSNTINRRIAA